MLTLTGRAVGNGLALSCHTGNEWVGQAVAAPLRPSTTLGADLRSAVSSKIVRSAFRMSSNWCGAAEFSMGGRGVAWRCWYKNPI